jgi:NAD(P)-dependent dehydrogenase (short-subunit alcohol dehydrogenase family)
MGRQVVVTGGGTGIGRAVAARFAAGGDEVVVTGRRQEPLAEVVGVLGPAVRAVRFDAADPAQVEAALADLPERVDVLVNNAGGNTDLDGDERDGLAAVLAAWRANLDANLLTAVAVTTALFPRLAAGGAVVSIGSIAQARGSRTGGYGAAKAALATWSLQLAGELGPRDVTSNVVAPGFVDQTEFFRDRLTADGRASRAAEAVTGRAGAPDDIAAAVHFLASPCARHITGQTLHVNGGALTTR